MKFTKTILRLRREYFTLAAWSTNVNAGAAICTSCGRSRLLGDGSAAAGSARPAPAQHAGAMLVGDLKFIGNFFLAAGKIAAHHISSGNLLGWCILPVAIGALNDVQMLSNSCGSTGERCASRRSVERFLTR